MKLLWKKIYSSPVVGGVLEDAKPYSLVNVLFYALIFVIIGIFVFVLLNYSATEGNTQSFILLAVTATMLTLVYNIRRHISEDYCKEAKEHFKKAFEIINPKQGEVQPKNDRFLWLTCARFLKVSERFGRKIIMKSHRDMYLEDRQYWRAKFMEIIKDFPSDYYAEKPMDLMWHGSNVKAPLAESSLYVIYNFIQWDENYADPLDSYQFSNEEIERMQTRGPRGLGNLLAAHRELRGGK